MTYNKPHNVTYTQMAIWIDENHVKDDCDDTKLYEYLYHLLYMIAHQHNYFRTLDQYDDYALQGASRLFLRLKDDRQYGESPTLKPVKSILNYIKTISYPYKVDFEQTTYIETLEDTLILHTDNINLSNYIEEETDIFDRIEFEQSLDSISAIVRDYLKKIPYKKHSSEFKNIYISCMLTLLNSITVISKDVYKIRNDLSSLDTLLCKIYKKSRYQDAILYHLPNSMENYIKVLVREIEHAVAKELSILTHSNISSEISIKNILAANLEEVQWA